MVDFDSLKSKAGGLVEGHKDQLEGAIDKAADMAGDKFGHEEQIDGAANKLKGLIPGE